MHVSIELLFGLALILGGLVFVNSCIHARLHRDAIRERLRNL